MQESGNSIFVDSGLLDEARHLGIDASTVAERALLQEIRRRRSPAEHEEATRKWKEENAEAIASSNRYFEEHGFPFPQYRRY
ncbi:type II toxin-antitoxin system CcdA family antitoxin [Rhizobium sp. LjRoot254]|uniref:type II toxin-antitoxin system CcdA family antitoxin n=1 Tax=Rhizobium sp. LjRoot254 TaxID=3342297 RepID=UPI003ECE70AF